jgi:predicted RNA-binding Zn-ribbon protein involved in translation (DUF1610 family)
MPSYCPHPRSEAVTHRVDPEGEYTEFYCRWCGLMYWRDKDGRVVSGA